MPAIKELQRPTLPSSPWVATSSDYKCFHPLAEDASVDVLVIGGGFTGLSSALHLREIGHEVMVLEAAEPGWGASGRNGGQVIPGLKYDPDELEQRYGPDLGPRVVATAGNAADYVFRLIERYNIQCDAVQNGWIQPAHGHAALKIVERRAKQWHRRGVETEIVDAGRVRDLIGCQAGYVGGWIDPRGGAVQPLSYARGLARAAAENGASIYGHSRVRTLRHDGGRWVAETSGGQVTADKLIIATNGYSDGVWQDIPRSIVPVYSFQVATAPLPSAIRSQIFPEGHVASDSRRLLWYYRLDSQGRLLMGGRGPYTDLPTFRHGERLRPAIAALFPQIADIGLEYVWSGRVAMTWDHMPHLHVLGNNAFAGVGFNGRGVAMGTTMGRLLAEVAAGRAPEEIDFPITKLSPIPFHTFNRSAVLGMAGYYRYLDAKESRAS